MKRSAKKKVRLYREFLSFGLAGCASGKRYFPIIQMLSDETLATNMLSSKEDGDDSSNNWNTQNLKSNWLKPSGVLSL